MTNLSPLTASIVVITPWGVIARDDKVVKMMTSVSKCLKDGEEKCQHRQSWLNQQPVAFSAALPVPGPVDPPHKGPVKPKLPTNTLSLHHNHRHTDWRHWACGYDAELMYGDHLTYLLRQQDSHSFIPHPCLITTTCLLGRILSCFRMSV